MEMNRNEMLSVVSQVRCYVLDQLGKVRDALLAPEVDTPPLPEKCPKCGEGIHHTGTTEKTNRAWAVGKCGSTWWSNRTFCERTDTCRIRELEQVVEWLRASLQNIRDKGRIEPRSPMFYRTLANGALAAADKGDG